MKTKRAGTYRTTLLSIVASMFALAQFNIVPVAWAAPATPDSEEVTNLLSELKTQAIQLRADAEDLKSFTRSTQMTWQSHALKLSRITEHVNDSGQLLTKLQNARASASPWQQQAIDRAAPLLKELAASVSATIQHLSKNQSRIHTAQYREYVAANADLATDLSSMITDYLAYGEAKNRAEELGTKLESPGS